MRLGSGPCTEEQAFLSRRKKVVARALKQALQLDEDLQEDEVQNCSGLGWGFLGPSALGLSTLQLLEGWAGPFSAPTQPHQVQRWQRERDGLWAANHILILSGVSHVALISSTGVASQQGGGETLT